MIFYLYIEKCNETNANTLIKNTFNKPEEDEKQLPQICWHFQGLS
jgi:hypothetical protein